MGLSGEVPPDDQLATLSGHRRARSSRRDNQRLEAVGGRCDDMRDLWLAELHRVEEVLDARLKHLETAAYSWAAQVPPYSRMGARRPRLPSAARLLPCPTAHRQSRNRTHRSHFSRLTPYFPLGAPIAPSPVRGTRNGRDIR